MDMRTTLIIDDAVFAEAKERAARRGKTLSDLVTLSLREFLREGPEERAAPSRFVMPVFGVSGETVGLSPREIATLRDEGR